METVTNPETEVTETPEVEDDFAEFEANAVEEDTEADDTPTDDDDDDNPDGETPEAATVDDDGFEEVEIDGWKGRVPKEAALRQADYTRKTQDLAEQRKQVEASLERLTAIDEAQTRAIAQVAINHSQLEQYKDIDWDAWDEADLRESQKHWRIFQQLKEQQNEAIAQYNSVGEAQRSVVQQETAKRLEQADRFASEKIPGWSMETAKATLDFSRSTYGLTDSELASAISEKPEVLMLLHDAMEGRKLRATAATKDKVVKQQAVKPVPTLKGNSGRPAFNPATTDFAAFEKHASKAR